MTNEIGDTRRSFLSKLFAAGAVAIAVPALKLLDGAEKIVFDQYGNIRFGSPEEVREIVQAFRDSPPLFEGFRVKMRRDGMSTIKQAFGLTQDY